MVALDSLPAHGAVLENAQLDHDPLALSLLRLVLYSSTPIKRKTFNLGYKNEYIKMALSKDGIGSSLSYLFNAPCPNVIRWRLCGRIPLTVKRNNDISFSLDIF